MPLLWPASLTLVTIYNPCFLSQYPYVKFMGFGWVFFVPPAMLLQCFSVQQVVDVYMGPKGLLSASDSVRPSLLIDASTVDPQTCRRLAKRVADCKLSSNSSMYISIGAISNLQGILFFQNENCKIKVLNAKWQHTHLVMLAFKVLLMVCHFVGDICKVIDCTHLFCITFKNIVVDFFLCNLME